MKVDNNEQKILELQAKLYRAIKEYYPSLDSLAKKLQDDYNDGVSFVQREEDPQCRYKRSDEHRTR